MNMILLRKLLLLLLIIEITILTIGVVQPVFAASDKGYNADKFGVVYNYKKGLIVRGTTKICCQRCRDGVTCCDNGQKDYFASLCNDDLQADYDQTAVNFGTGPIGLPASLILMINSNQTGLVKRYQTERLEKLQANADPTDGGGTGENFQLTVDNLNRYKNPQTLRQEIADYNNTSKPLALNNISGFLEFPYNYNIKANTLAFNGSTGGIFSTLSLALPWTETPDKAIERQKNPSKIFSFDYQKAGSKEPYFDYNAKNTSFVRFPGGSAPNYCYPERDGGKGRNISYGFSGGSGGENDVKSDTLASSNVQDAAAYLTQLSLPPQIPEAQADDWYTFLGEILSSFTDYFSSFTSIFNGTRPTDTRFVQANDLPLMYESLYIPKSDNIIFANYPDSKDALGSTCSNKCFRKSVRKDVRFICAGQFFSCNGLEGTRIGTKWMGSTPIVIGSLYGDLINLATHPQPTENSIEGGAGINRPLYLLDQKNMLPYEATWQNYMQAELTADDVIDHIISRNSSGSSGQLTTEKKAYLDDLVAGKIFVPEVYIAFPVSMFWATTPQSLLGCTYSTFEGEKVFPGIMTFSTASLRGIIRSLKPNSILYNKLSKTNNVEMLMDALGFKKIELLIEDRTLLLPKFAPGSFGKEYEDKFNKARRDCYNPETAGCRPPVEYL